NSTGLTENNLANNAVTTSKIANLNITEEKLANNAVTTDKIVDGTITDVDISVGASIDGSKISPIFTTDVSSTGNYTTNAGSFNTSTGNFSTTTGDFLLNGGSIVPDFVFEKYYN